MPQMQPLQVTFEIDTPMRAPEEPIHLDALLAWAAVEEAGGDIAAQERLPLERYEAKDGQWVWCASRVIPRVLFRDQMPAIRAFRPADWARAKGEVFQGGPNKVSPGTGPYKAYQFSIPTIQVDFARAWCIGDPHRVVDLLDRVSHLGKLRRLGCGRVRTVRVEKDPLAEERWKLRTMPDAQEGYRQAHMTLRPPYWDRRARALAWEPPLAACVRALD